MNTHPSAPSTAGLASHGPRPDEEIVLAGGEHLTIRSVGRGDIELERRFIQALSPASRRFRFLDTMRTPSDALLEQLTVIDPATDVAFMAVVRAGRTETAVGAGRFSAAVDGHDCEFALAVADEWQGKGLGSVLMGRLMRCARARGIAHMHSSDFADNDLMRKVAARLGLEHRTDPEDATLVLYSVEVTPGRGKLIELAQQGASSDWCHSLGCTEHELIAAIATVGPEGERVREYLSARRQATQTDPLGG